MEGNEKIHKKNGISKNVVLNILDFAENITELDLSNRNLCKFCDNIQIPPNLVNLNLSQNKLDILPHAVLTLDKLEVLNISYNLISYFDNPPAFVHTIQCLNISNNKLKRPPTWVWTETPRSLVQLNISNNTDISNSLVNGLIQEWLEYEVLVKEIYVHNCKLSNLKLLSTVRSAKTVHVGHEDPDFINYQSVNHIEHIPCEGLDKCCDIERLNLCNTHIYMINSNIDIYKHIKELNLAQNNIMGLPNEFCNLENLEICVLSVNKLLYLPENLHRLKKLVELCLDSNNLCMLPECMESLPSLRILDLYDNHLCDPVVWVDKLEEFDCAQNYFEEPLSEEYVARKLRIRAKYPDRADGRKMEVIKDDSEYSKDSEDEDYDITYSDPLDLDTRSSSSEDWDSDDYWIPQYFKAITPPRSPWLYFVKKKMEEGNFCPMDAHLVSVADKVRYERECNPRVVYESDGQFDDFSGDDT